MKLKQHLEIGNNIIKELEDNKNSCIDTVKLNKAAYLAGNIAPDLNCIYPAHRLSTTEKRFYRLLKFVNKDVPNILKSFALGIITHYICDYFCYAHNIESIGIKHKQYETHLYNYYESHFEELKESNARLKSMWKKEKASTLNENVENGTIDSDTHCKFVIEQIKRMSKQYRIEANECVSKSNTDWFCESKQMKVDMEYSMFMIEHIISIVLEPFKCLVPSL